MLFDSTIMACCLDEIAQAAVGATIRDFRQPRRLAVVMELDLPQPSRLLTLSAEAERSRIHLAATAPKATGDAYPLEAFGRKHLRGSRISRIRQLGFDRVGRIDLEVRNPRLIDPVTSIVVELMGKHSNVLLLNNVGTILEAMKHITPELSRLRTVLPHRDYELPPTGVGMDPRGATPTEVTEALLRHDALPLGRALSRAYDGVSRILADEIGYRAGVDVERTVSALDPLELQQVGEAVAEVMDAIRHSRWSPVIFEGRKGPSHYAFPLAHLSRESEMRPVPSLCESIARHAESERERGEAASRRAEVTSAIRSALDHVGSRLAELREQADPRPADEARRRAEALAAALHTVRLGMDEARVPDPYSATGDEIVITLDSRRAPGENLRRLFDRARRLQEAARRAPERQQAAEADRGALEECLSAAERADDPVELERLLRRAERHGARRGRTRTEDGERDSFPSRKSSDGYEILFGRNSEESDRLLREVAASDDWWFHARDLRGGHVIIRTRKQPDRVPKRTIAEAARLAAFLSKARHSSLVPVDYTLRKYVRKARKGPPGLHIFEREKTLMVEPLRSVDDAF